MKSPHCIFLLFALTLTTWGFSQSSSPAAALKEFELHYNKAVTYDEISLYGPCIEELNAAIDHAAAHHLDEQRINAVIMLAEVMRKTLDYDKGLELLASLEETASYPQLHVRKLGRIAAIYNERPSSPGINKKDSVLHYLGIALKLATSLHLPEAAGLYNELGYTLCATDREAGLSYLLKSAKLFRALNDTHNYAGTMTNVLRCHLASADTAKARLVINELLPLIRGKQWYTAEVELYNNIASYHRNQLKDSVTAQYWYSKADKSYIANLMSINSSQVNAFRNLYETKKLKEQVTEMEQEGRLKQEALDRQTARTRELILYLSLLTLLIVGVIALLLRERQLKRRLTTTNAELQVSNEKYQELMVESNHRIKNNLQMIISMMQYSGPERSNSPDAFKRMSDKIQTISALHQQLSVDVHNELVPMDAYFKGIVALYGNISPTIPAITCDVSPVGIRSERIVYFGLILNEMLANTFEHRTSQSHTITITVRRSGPNYLFDYADGSFHDPTAAKGTGSTLIRQLIQRVGGSEFRFKPADGHYQFLFHD